jgi:toxin ParE1/3/4
LRDTMPRILRTPQSELDVLEITIYIARDSIAAADRLVDLFDAKLRALSLNPGLGPKRPELGDGVQSLPVGNYILFYRRIDDGIELLRILHGARDLRRIFRN